MANKGIQDKVIAYKLNRSESAIAYRRLRTMKISHWRSVKSPEIKIVLPQEIKDKLQASAHNQGLFAAQLIRNLIVEYLNSENA